MKTMWHCALRIGKGEGFADLEWALAASNHGGAVSKNTLVATTVHDCQESIGVIFTL